MAWGADYNINFMVDNGINEFHYTSRHGSYTLSPTYVRSQDLIDSALAISYM